MIGTTSGSQLSTVAALRQAQRTGYWGDTWKGFQHGSGTQAFTNGDVYQGNWVKGRIEGHGVYLYADGSRYDGNFVDHQRNGTGVFTSANGDVYDGEWKDGERHGVGTMHYGGTATGEWYKGGFRQNRRSGEGVYHYPNGDEYSGQWLGGCKHGKGCLKFADGDLYKGGWQDDLPHGHGAFVVSGGRRTFRGTFLHGSLSNIDQALQLQQYLASKGSAPGPRLDRSGSSAPSLMFRVDRHVAQRAGGQSEGEEEEDKTDERYFSPASDAGEPAERAVVPGFE